MLLLFSFVFHSEVYKLSILIILLFFYPHPKTCLLTLERGEGREREGGGEKHPLAAPRRCPDWDCTHSPGVYPDWESSPQPFSSWDDALINWVTLTRADYFIIPFIFEGKCKDSFLNHNEGNNNVLI